MTHTSYIYSINLEIGIRMRLIGTDDLLDRDRSQSRLTAFLLIQCQSHQRLQAWRRVYFIH
jgi:hypothetical protein